MGPDRRHAPRGRSGQLTRAAQVVPDLPTFAVDDGFTYAIPDALSGVGVGSIVRVPLGGRHVRGFVVGIRPGQSTDRALKDVAAVSGDLSGFDKPHLETLRWAALHYVAPLAAVLPRALPPNLPRAVKAAQPSPWNADAPPSPLPAATTAAASGQRLRPQYLLASAVGWQTVAGLVADVLAAGRGALVVAPTVVEATALAAALEGLFGNTVDLASSALAAGPVTRAWARARLFEGRLVVGTREVAFWPVERLAMAVVVEEGRRGMKAPQTPTTHVRDVLRRRAAVERFQLVFAGPVPTTEALAAGAAVHGGERRAWPLVEVVDRAEEPPGSGFVAERVRRALAIAVNDGKRGFVLVHRRGYAPAFRCVRCRTVRRCAMCGAALTTATACRRCGTAAGPCARCGGERFEPLGAGVGRIVDDLRRTLHDSVGAAGSEGARVEVGTERDLAHVHAIDLAVAVDLDGVMLAPHYRAAEDALRLGARLAGKVLPRSGNRAVVQTGMPDHPVIEALRRGRPLPFLEAELEDRAEAGFPPAGELVALDVRNAPGGADEALREVAGDLVRGPAAAGEGTRWLLQGPSLREEKVRLRGLVQRWRDAGARVRVDVDPIDL